LIQEYMPNFPIKLSQQVGPESLQFACPNVKTLTYKFMMGSLISNHYIHIS